MQLMKGGGILIRVSCYLQATVIDKSLSGTWTASKPPKESQAPEKALCLRKRPLVLSAWQAADSFCRFCFITKE